MGLSASQARLLSITARLTDNEMHSQQIGNAKVRLAGKTQDASKEYIESLNAKKMVFTTYDAKGNSTMQNLTPALMYEYAPLKNQYGISDASGQLLVGGLDAMNFESSGNVAAFVEKYGIELTDNPKFKIAVQMLYGDEYERFLDHDGLNNFGSGGASGWIGEWNKDMTKAQYNTWLKRLEWTDAIYGAANGTYRKLIDKLRDVPDSPADKPTPPEYNPPQQPNPDDYAQLRDFVDVIHHNSCYGYAQRGKNCFMHVLSDMLGVGSHTTSDGHTFEVKSDISWNWNSAKHPNLDGLADVQQIIRETKSIVEPDKTIYQRIVDFLWASHESYDGTATGGQATQEHLDEFFDIVDNDLANAPVSEYDAAMQEYNEEKAEYDEQYNTEYQEYSKKLEYYEQRMLDGLKWQDECNDLYNKYIDELQKIPTPTIPDPEDPKTEWYVNLWHRMNGESDYKSSDGLLGKYYKQLDDNLFKSEEWLKFVLEHGIVTMEHVQFIDPSLNETGLENAKWQSTIYTSCVDISSVDDEAAIARAEAEYNHKLKEIEVKDKKYDNEIKKLDTEHNALQTEYDSIKEIINKNEERSFKAFS